MRNPLRRSKNIHWRPVDPARLPTYMRKNAEAGQTGGESARDPVRRSQIERCYPPFAEADQEDRNRKDCQNGDDPRGDRHSNRLHNGCRYPFDPLFSRSQNNQNYANDNEHSRPDQFSACDQISERLEGHDGGVSEARPCSEGDQAVIRGGVAHCLARFVTMRRRSLWTEVGLSAGVRSIWNNCGETSYRQLRRVNCGSGSFDLPLCAPDHQFRLGGSNHVFRASDCLIDSASSVGIKQ
jgi:hypothetical protein